MKTGKFTISIPSQMTTLAEKEADDYALIKQTVDGYIAASKFEYGKYEEDEERWPYQVYNGEKIESHYIPVEDPFGTLNTDNPMPLRDVKPWNILRQNVDIIINEKAKRPFNFTAVVKNPDAETRFLETKREEKLQAVRQRLINHANEQGQQTGVPSKEVDMSQLTAKDKQKYLDSRAQKAQTIAKIALSEERIRNKWNRLGMKHFVIGGEACSYKGIRNGSLVYEIINNLDIDFIKGPDVRYGRDAEACVYRMLMPFSEFVDNFREIVDEKDLKDLEASIAGTSPAQIMFRTSDIEDRGKKLRWHIVECYHVVFRTYKQRGYITYIDEFDEVQEIQVDDKFKKKDFPFEIIDEEWEWLTCIYETLKYDKNKYAGMSEIPYTARELDNKSLAPLPYNSVTFSDLNSKNTSLVKDGYIYQYYHNVYKAKLEKLISNDKGRVPIVDIAALGDMGMGKGNIDKVLYYLETNKIMFIDTRRPQARNYQNWGAALDFSQGNAVAQLVDVINLIRQELDMTMGITPQRRGDVSPSAGKGATEHAIARSYTVSEGIFIDFEEWEEIEMNDILNVAKVVYASNKKGVYIIDSEPVMLDLDPNDNIAEEELGIVMSKATPDKEKLEMYRQMVLQPLAQNIGKPGVTADVVSEIVYSDNVSEIKLSMQKADDAMNKYNEMMAKQQQEAQQAQIQAEAAKEDKAMAHEASENALDRAAKLEEARIKAAGFEEETLITDVDTSAFDKINQQSIKDGKEYNIKKEQLELEKKKHRDEIKENEKQRAHEQKLKDKDLKNPVSGERKK